MLEKEIEDKSSFSFYRIFKSLLYFMPQDKFKFILHSCIVFICNMHSLITTFIIGLIVNFFTNYKAGDSLNTFYLYCVIIVIVHSVMSIIRLNSKKKLSGYAIDAEYSVRVKGFEKLLEFSLSWHDKENSGNKTQRIQTGSKAIGNLVRMMANGIIPVFATFTGIIAIFIYLNVYYLLFVAAYLGLFFFIEYIFNRKMYHINNKRNIALEKANGTYIESTSNILSLKSLGAKKSMSNNVKNNEDVTKDFNLKLRNLGIKKWQWFQLLNGISIGVFLLIIGNDLINGSITVGFIFVYISYYQKVRSAAVDVTRISSSLVEYESALKRTVDIFDTKEEKWFGSKKFPKKWSKFSFKDVSFEYKGSGKKKFSVKDMNFDINNKEKIGVVGHSGSGKSTLAKLMLGLYKIKKGSIKVGERDFYSMSHEKITDNITIVLQESELFNMSFKDNITMLKTFDRKLFDLVVDIAQLKSVLKKLPEGIETSIGEKGYKLSGGERQRLGIARAIYKDSDILVLDEATSALDSKLEAVIQRKIETKLKHKTLIIIAHRLSTLKNVDRIIVFDKGKIVEQGKFKELLKDDKSKFYKIWNSQMKK